MNIDNFDTWFGVKKVTSGKGEELEQYRDLFEECWNESRAELPEVRKQLRDAQAELDEATDEMYTDDQVEDRVGEIKMELQEDVETNLEKLIEDFKEDVVQMVRSTIC